MSGQKEQSSVGREFEEEKDDFHLPAQRNCTECVPQVMGTGVAQKCTLGIHYKANTQHKFKTSLLVWRRGQGSGHLPHPAIAGSQGNQDNLKGLEITGQGDSTELQWGQAPAQPLTHKTTLPTLDCIVWKQ